MFDGHNSTSSLLLFTPPSNGHISLKIAMEVVNARSALLSNYEVLELLREFDAVHVARMKTAQRIKKEEEEEATKKGPNYEKPLDRRDPTVVDIPDNLRTVELEAIQYLAADYQPTAKQTPTGIQKLTKDMAAYDFTKGEKLQIVNLAPVEQVELYTIIEDLEDRLATDEEREAVLQLVRDSLVESAPGPSKKAVPQNETEVETIVYEAEQAGWGEGYEEAYEEEHFDDTGEGRGVEGDLDMEED